MTTKKKHILTLYLLVTLALAGHVWHFGFRKAPAPIRWPMPAKWTAEFGDSYDSQIAYNLVLLQSVAKQHHAQLGEEPNAAKGVPNAR
jgi:hypothetical protein